MKLGHDISESKARWPDITDELLNDLQAWATERSLPKVPQEQLAIFAHSCYYNKTETLRCMDVYYRMRATVAEFFNDRDPVMDRLKHCSNVASYIRLPIPDKQGNRIIFHSLLDTNPSHYVFNDSVTLLFMAMDVSLYSDGCVPGHIFLFDMRGVKISHIMRLSISSLRRFFEYLQEAMPVRLKSIHVINCVWFVDKWLALVKPFMKKELLDILHLHTGDVSEVYQYIPPECLPKDFGGELDDVKALHAEQCQKFVELRGYFLEEERLYRGYRDSSRKSTAACARAEDITIGRDEDVAVDLD